MGRRGDRRDGKGPGKEGRDQWGGGWGKLVGSRGRGRAEDG